jgi:hypothetical protein
MHRFEWVVDKVNKKLAVEELSNLQFRDHQFMVGRHFFDTLVL